jgi:uncharacterized repeat protein (TIGR01451 family)
MKRQIVSILVTLAALLVLPLTALAEPKVAISIKAEKEITVKEKGKTVKKRVPTKGVTPGEEIIYTLSYQNSGNEPATNVALSDPIPAGTVYINGSATEKGELTFSIDKGKSFKKPTLLTYEVTTAGKAEKRTASPDDYTDIRWILSTLAPGEKGSVSFRVKVR